MKRYGLCDHQFARIEHLLPGRLGSVGKISEIGNRVFVEVDLEIPHGRAGAQSAGALRRLEEHSQALLALGGEWRLGESFQSLGI